MLIELLVWESQLFCLPQKQGNNVMIVAWTKKKIMETQ